MSLKRDYILRIIEQLAEAVARILALRSNGIKTPGFWPPMDLRMAGAVDTATVARHLADPVRMAALARLMHERAGLAGDQGDAAAERSWRQRAVELWRAAGAAGATLDEVARGALREAGDS